MPRHSSLDWIKEHLALGEKAAESRDELIERLRRANAAHVIDAEALKMCEGALKVSDICAGDIMVPRAQMEVIDISEPREQWIAKMVSSGHSRFPVVEDDIDNVRGIVHSKDMLRVFLDPSFDVRTKLRAARFVPETQKLNVLLKGFRATRNHVALVIDEFGSVSGLITLEDVIEQVVGDIDDEFDKVDADRDNIIAIDGEHWRVMAQTTLEQFNEFFQSSLTDTYCETVGGVVTDRFEHVPHRGETIEIEGFRFRVLKGDERQAKLFLVERTLALPGSAAQKEDNHGDA